jgi:hypothetical protein
MLQLLTTPFKQDAQKVCRQLSAFGALSRLSQNLSKQFHKIKIMSWSHFWSKHTLAGHRTNENHEDSLSPLPRLERRFLAILFSISSSHLQGVTLLSVSTIIMFNITLNIRRFIFIPPMQHAF